MKPYIPICILFLSILFFQTCKSYDQLSSSSGKKELVTQINLHVNSLNERNRVGLEKVYANDYEGLHPVTKFQNKAELINILLKNQEKNNITIQSKILEVHARKSMAYALLHWVAVSNPNTLQEEVLYERIHFQIWEKEGQKNWKLKRSLFY